jgi:Skp family chaperone for outer membrane proteins
LEAAVSSAAAAPALPDKLADKPSAMSKNRRDKLELEVKKLEESISILETELKALEAGFADPAPEMNWEAAHRRHAEIGKLLESQYAELTHRWEQIGL